jgi:hypothetical protein
MAAATSGVEGRAPRGERGDMRGDDVADDGVDDGGVGAVRDGNSLRLYAFGWLMCDGRWHSTRQTLRCGILASSTAATTSAIDTAHVGYAYKAPTMA